MQLQFNFVYLSLIGSNGEDHKAFCLRDTCCTVMFKNSLICCFSLAKEGAHAVVRDWRNSVAVDTVDLRKHR